MCFVFTLDVLFNLKLIALLLNQLYLEYILLYLEYTGSSRKNGKSKTVCTGIHFHKSWVFSAVLGTELATNLSSKAPRSTTITRRHPKKLAYLKCFLALIDCLRPTTALPHLSKDPHCVLRLVRTKISRMNTYRFFFTANFTPLIPKTHFGYLLRVSESVVGLRQPPRA